MTRRYILHREKFHKVGPVDPGPQAGKKSPGVSPGGESFSRWSFPPWIFPEESGFPSVNCPLTFPRVCGMIIINQTKESE